MRITQLDTFILHVPVTRQEIADSTHRITHWGAPGVVISTDCGIQGIGYSGTHAHLPTDRLITSCIADSYSYLLIGEDPECVEGIWKKLFHCPPLQWVGRGGITHFALGAIDIALWDIKAKAADKPLWQLLGADGPKPLTAYNTDVGWLNKDDETLAADCRRVVEIDGFAGVKIKVGSKREGHDLRRIESVRRALGDDVQLMVDANGRFDLLAATQLGKRLCDFDIAFFEEPMWYDDLDGHRRLAESIVTPIALGEQLYLVDHFKSFIEGGAVQCVQPDVTRLAGVTEWWQAANLAWSHRLPVVPHIGDMMQVHLHCALAHQACTMLEYIPWMRDCFLEPATVENGVFVLPQSPGAGTTLREDALAKFQVA